MKLKQWTSDPNRLMRVRIYEGIIKYLASQTQYKLPYCVPFVNGNDQIFIGNDGFKTKANEVMDFCFAEILEFITSMNENKSEHLEALITICMIAANLLVSVCQVSVKKVSSFINKLFKMSDGYVNDLPDGPDSPKVKQIRTYINKTFDSFKRKKESEASDANMRASIASEQSEQA